MRYRLTGVVALAALALSFDVAAGQSDDDTAASISGIGPPPLCAATPLSGCRIADRAYLGLREVFPGRGDRFLLRWQRGESTAKSEFGQPEDQTNYAVCMYNGTPATSLAGMQIPFSADLWRDTPNGYYYGDSRSQEDGVRKILLRSNARNRTRVTVRGAGFGLPDFNLPVINLPLLVQVVNDASSACWEVSFSATDIGDNNARHFRATRQDR